MIDGRTVLALIPARSGSKGLPGKNLAKVKGRSLVARAVEAAKASLYVDRILISSDDLAIIAEGCAAGAEAPFIRPADLSDDTASSASVVLHALSAVSPQPDYLVLLQPTSPLRTALDVDRCLEACLRDNASACLTLVEMPASPHAMYWRGEDGRISPVVPMGGKPTRRQDMPSAFAPNGAVYVVAVVPFLARPDFMPTDTLGLVMPLDRSIDIDTATDLDLAEAVAHRYE